MDYTPDRWVVFNITTENDSVDKILAGWYGGFGGSDSWKISSGISETIEEENRYVFKNYSGSTYYCFKGAHGMSMYMMSIMNNLLEGQEKNNYKVTILSIGDNSGK